MKFIIYISTLLLLVSCATAPEQNQAVITDINDFNTYLQMDRKEVVADLKSQAVSIKETIQSDTTRIVQMSRLAGLNNNLYDTTGNIDYLIEAVSLREKVLNNTYINPESARRALAQLYIKQHRFKDAHTLMTAVEANEKEDQLVKFDIAMELGLYDEALSHLNSIKNLRDYNYLIRAAKWNDYKGKLDDTIRLMEQAMELAEESGSQNLMLWSYSNIADYYGHHGDIDLSYKYYLKTLELDPQNDYALKGISWIAFSNDDNPALAAQIITTLQERHAVPDYLLSLADVYEHQGKEEQATDLRTKFLDETTSTSYGGMYNTYRIETLLAGTAADKAAGLELAVNEVENRATPETYDLLGYAYLINGQSEKALEIHNANVLDKTFEPVAQLHLAQVLKSNDNRIAAMEIKKELLEARYELGPVTIKEVEKI